MIKTKVYCDHCGKEIKNFNRTNITIESCKDSEWQRSTMFNQDFQFCNSCYSDLFRYIENYTKGCNNG